MSDIIRVDTDGVRSILNVGELAVDNYVNSNDKGRIYTGDGVTNKGLKYVGEGIDTINGKSGTTVTLDKNDIGLGNVDNTKDLDKPISTAVNAELEYLRAFKAAIELKNDDTNEVSGYIRSKPLTMGVMEVHGGDATVHTINQNSVYSVRHNATTWYDGTAITPNVAEFRCMPVDNITPLVVYVEGSRVEMTNGHTVPLTAYGVPIIIKYADGYKEEINPDSSLFGESPITAWIELDASDTSVVQFGDERHGIAMDGVTHEYLHNTVGTKYVNGLGVQGLSIGGTTHATMEAGVLYDEDIKINIDNNADASFIYRTANTWGTTIKSNLLTHLNGGTTATYNVKDVNGDWSLVPTVDGEFITYIYACTNNKLSMFTKIVPQKKYTSVTEAGADILNAVKTLDMSALPIPEIVILGAWITNHLGELQSYNGGLYLDLRDANVSGAPGVTGTVSDHRQTTNRDTLDSHPATAISLSAITNHATITNVQELAVNLYDIIDNPPAQNIVFEEKTSTELSLIPVTANTIYWCSDTKRYVYGDTIIGKWVYFGAGDVVKVPGTGTGPAGIFSESWEDDITVIATRWSSPNNTFNTVSNNATTAGYINKRTGSTPSGGTGPSSAADGTYYIYTECSSNGHLTDFTIETENFARLTNISFKYNMYGSDMGTFKLLYYVDNVWVERWSVSGDQGSGWIDVSFDSEEIYNAAKIRFEHTGATSYHGDLAIDNITITSI